MAVEGYAPLPPGTYAPILSRGFITCPIRAPSSDSQNWGPLPLGDVIGKAVLVYWPPEQMGLITHFGPAVAAEAVLESTP